MTGQKSTSTDSPWLCSCVNLISSVNPHSDLVKCRFQGLCRDQIQLISSNLDQDHRDLQQDLDHLQVFLRDRPVAQERYHQLHLHLSNSNVRLVALELYHQLHQHHQLRQHQGDHSSNSHIFHKSFQRRIQCLQLNR